jgi:hypothetical protein
MTINAGPDMCAEPFDKLRTALVEARPSTGSGLV